MKIQLNVIDYPDRRGYDKDFDPYPACHLLYMERFEMPYLPLKGMRVDLTSFVAGLPLSEAEAEFFEDNKWVEIKEIYMHLDFLELDVTYEYE